MRSLLHKIEFWSLESQLLIIEGRPNVQIESAFMLLHRTLREHTASMGHLVHERRAQLGKNDDNGRNS